MVSSGVRIKEAIASPEVRIGVSAEVKATRKMIIAFTRLKVITTIASGRLYCSLYFSGTFH